MIYFKGCTKCRWDQYLEEDTYGSFFKCLQCGRIVDVEARGLHQKKPTTETVTALAA